MSTPRAAGNLSHRFRSYAARRPWLGYLFASFDILDAGLAAARALETARRGVAPPCAPGCDHCCRNQVVPVTPLEVAGLAWFAVEMTHGALRAKLAARLANTPDNECPFLVEGGCAAYAVRPMPCRKFMVFGARCLPREDVWRTRRNDLLTPPEACSREALAVTLPYYGITSPAEIRAALEEDYFPSIASDLYKCDWHGVAARMAG
ncbi:MAG: YkgJ family cysteine cluster protein [Desulfovibrionaceae bacterium]